MAKQHSKQFTISEGYQLFSVDRWWAGLLQAGAKIVTHVEWLALGETTWRLKVCWETVEGGGKMNVGHPRYADLTNDEVDSCLQDFLADFEALYTDYQNIEKKVKDWEIEEVLVEDEEPYWKVDFRESLDEAEKIIALEFLWPHFKELKKELAYMTTRLQELDQEIKARASDDYYSIEMDRGMLRQAFSDQVGYDNEYLFEYTADPHTQPED